ncbi:site-2 protease family protein [Pseudoduganella sp. RAF19]|uniref:site-2 protease family protein n=1 Tax=Pseudoduganella sp. RAF19 TaxID=3233052 RepID=UPI003F9CBDCB
MSDLSQTIQTIAVYAIPVLFAISLHEAAHGYVARYFGDDTAERMGRLSANPARHIDPIGTILLPLMLHLAHLPPFGYAKPVPVDYSRLRNPKKQMGFVAAAGPLANFAMGLLWLLMFNLIAAMGVQEPFLIEMARGGVLVNAAMCAFNLIPIPPLDGGRIVTALLPHGLAMRFASIERLGPIVFILLIVLLNTGPFRSLLTGLMYFVIYLFGLVLTPITIFLS